MERWLRGLVLRRPQSGSKGQAAVEFALVLVIAMIVLFVAIQMALIGQAALALGQVNYQGARFAAVNPSDTCDQIASYMQSVASPTITKNGFTCGTNCNTASTGVTVCMTCPGVSGGCQTPRAFGSSVEIDLAYDASAQLVLPNPFLGVHFPTSLYSQETAMVE